MRCPLLLSLLFGLIRATMDTSSSKNWFLDARNFLNDPLFTLFVLGSIITIFVIGTVIALVVIHVTTGKKMQSDLEQCQGQSTVSEADLKSKVEEELKMKKEAEEKERKEKREKEVLQMYEEWKAGKGIVKLAYNNVNPLPDPKYLVAEKGTVVESDVPFTVIRGNGEVIVEGRPRVVPKVEKHPSSMEKSTIKV